MLPAGASEGHHQVLEAALPVTAHAGIHQRHHAGEKLVYAFLLIQIIDYRRVFSGQRLEALFAAGIREAAAVKNKSAAVPALVPRQTAVKRETENPHDEIFRFARQP